MVRRCIYCKNELNDTSVIDFCQRCGVAVWGEKMFQTIVENYEKSRDSGNLFQGSITGNNSNKR